MSSGSSNTGPKSSWWKVVTFQKTFLQQVDHPQVGSGLGAHDACSKKKKEETRLTKHTYIKKNIYSKSFLRSHTS